MFPNFRPNAPSGPGNQDGFPEQHRTHIFLVQHNGIPTQQFLHIQGTQVVAGHPLGQHVFKLGHQLQFDLVGHTELGNFFFTFYPQSMNRQHHEGGLSGLNEFLVCLFQTEDAFALESFALLAAVIIDESQNFVFGLQGIEREVSGGSGSINQDRGLGHRILIEYRKQPFYHQA